jgi:2-polyprenyl-6-methoxyphenol hydroxylase-like FAD-dependent oxidoreductase
MSGRRIVVVGAGIGGLASALALSRSGHRVTIIERDDTPMPDDPESAFFEWDRRGAPQVRHPHVFLGLARTILRDRFPDVLQALTDLGITPSEIGSDPARPMDEETLAVLRADDDLRMLPVRRTTFEWVMRRAIIGEPGIELRLGQGVTGVEVQAPAGEGPPTVTGVRLEDGSTVEAELVVATTGRRGDVPAWLEAHGITVSETVGDAGVVYFSRFYRAEEEYGFGFRGGLSGGIGFGVIGSDAGTYSITAVVDRNDKELRAHLGDSARFDATIALLPEVADVVAAGGVPIGDVHCMTGLINRTRSFTDPSGLPLVRGLVAAGDAHTCTNPAYGRGQALAMRQAVLLADALADHDDLLDAARAYEAASTEQVVPWYHFSVLTDQMRAAALASGGSGAGGGDPFAALFGAGAGAVDPELIRLVLRVMNLLELPEALIARMPEMQAASAAAPKPEVDASTRLTRDDLLAVVA